jgi:hypothetical protein
MDIFALLGLDDASFYEFYLFGLMANVVAVAIAFVITLFRTFTLDEKELNAVILFSKTRDFYIVNYTPTWRRIGTFCMVFAPAYSVWINIVYLYYMLKTSGGWGIIKGTIESDNWQVFQMIRYEHIQKNK